MLTVYVNAAILSLFMARSAVSRSRRARFARVAAYSLTRIRRRTPARDLPWAWARIRRMAARLEGGR